MVNQDQVKHRGWVASLNNGETVLESDAVLAPGTRTPWGQLVDRCEREGLWITQLQLQQYGRNIVGIRGAVGYCFFNDWRVDGLRGSKGGKPDRREVHHYGLGSVIGNTVYCTILDKQGQTRQDSRPLSKMRLHCVLKPAQ